MKRIILVIATVLAALLVAYGAGTTINGTRVINGDLTVKGTCTGCGGGGGWVPVENHTVATAAAMTFTTCFSGTYTNYVIVLQNMIPATAGDNLMWRASTDGGMNYDSGNNYTWAAFRASDTGSAAAGQKPGPQIFIDGAGGLSTNANWGLSGLVNVMGIASGKYTRLAWGPMGYLDNSSAPIEVTGSGAYIVTTTVNALEFYFATGSGGTVHNITSGTGRCYGVTQ